MSQDIRTPANAAAGTSHRALRPWLMWGAGALFFCYAFFQRVAPSVMVEELMRDFAVGAAIAGTLSSLYFYPYAALQIPAGLLVDRFGPRRVLTLAALVAAVGSAAFAMADVIGLAYVGRGLVGAGAAVSWVAVLALASAWFPSNRFALLTGLTMAIGVAGGVGGQAPLSLLVDGVGWRGALFIAAALALVFAVFAWTVVRDRPPRADGHPQTGAHAGAGYGLLDRLRMTMREPQVWLIALFAGAIVSPMLSFAGLWGVPFMVGVHGMTKPEAAVVTSLMLVGWGVGSPLLGWMTDAIGRRKLPALIAAGGALVCTLGWLYAAPPVWLMYPLMILTGTFSGGIVVAFATARENAPSASGGAVIGLVNTAVMGSAAVFQPLIGWLLDLTWSGQTANGVRIYDPAGYVDAMIVLPLCQATALLAALLLRETYCTPRHA
ncbi:MFS transporter [Caenispirillum salinarum]|uniref:MFS transporter n=1 Tax=Caenispirillum salinarum TaxID=859058 RepID=UPI00384AEF6E